MRLQRLDPQKNTTNIETKTFIRQQCKAEKKTKGARAPGTDLSKFMFVNEFPRVSMQIHTKQIYD